MVMLGGYMSVYNFYQDIGYISATVYLLVCGVLLGIVVIAKIVEKLLKRYPNATMWGIIGLVVTSPFAILYGVNFAGISVLTVITSIITLVIGFFVARKMGE